MRCGDSAAAAGSRANALPSHLPYGGYRRAISRHSRMRSRTSRAATTADPSSSPTSPHRPTNASSWPIRCHWQARTYRQTSSGYQATRCLSVSNPRSSWKTAPPVNSAKTCVGVASQSRGGGCRGSKPRMPRAQLVERRDDHLRRVPEERARHLRRADFGQEEENAGRPVVVGGAFGVEAEDLRTGPDQRGAVRLADRRERPLRRRSGGSVRFRKRTSWTPFWLTNTRSALHYAKLLRSASRAESVVTQAEQ